MRFIIASAIIKTRIFAIKKVKKVKKEISHTQPLLSCRLTSIQADAHGVKQKRDSELRSIFHACFFEQFNTILKGNALEPLYSPSEEVNGLHTIYYRHDYFSSALHEIAHWCIASSARRQQIDYGYWYSPDGRTPAQQEAFEHVEVKPQAIEWAFSIACDIPFHVSIDNLDAHQHYSAQALAEQQLRFTQSVYQQLQRLVESGFNPRTSVFLSALHKFYNTKSLTNNDPRLRAMTGGY